MGELRGTSATGDVAVRMGMGAAEAEVIAALLPRLPSDVVDRVVDQLWLRAVFVEQRRRTGLAERVAFDIRADRILVALDPSDDDRLRAVLEDLRVDVEEWGVGDEHPRQMFGPAIDAALGRRGGPTS